LNAKGEPLKGWGVACQPSLSRHGPHARRLRSSDHARIAVDPTCQKEFEVPLISKALRLVRLGAYGVSIACATLMLLMGVLSPIWPWLWGLLMDLPGFAVAVLGWLAAALGLLFTPHDEFVKRRTWALIATLCVLSIFIYRTPDIVMPTVQLSSPLLEILLVGGLYRLFASLRRMGASRPLASFVVGSLWPISFFVVYELFMDPWAPIPMLIVNTVFYDLIVPRLTPALHQLAIYRDYSLLVVCLRATIPSVLLFGFLPATCLFLFERVKQGR
jgi:hypothetical protein